MKEEIILLSALSVLTLFLGLVFGGGFTYWYMPRTCSKVIETTSIEYQCYDGSKRPDLSECPEPNIPECEETKDVTKDTSEKQVVKVGFECTDCISKCPQVCSPGAKVTTTTIHVPVLPPCTSNADCGDPEYSEIRCDYDKTYKIYSEPFCDDGSCKVTQTKKIIRTCMDNERCQKEVGCVPYTESSEE
ncbi:MAG: hypothetical protein ABIH11_07960 [Candidatus Altiarchaeota archaeon]